MIDKSLIRKTALQKRDSLPAAEKRARDLEIEKRLAALPHFAEAKTVMCFASFRSEPDTFGIMAKVLAAGKRLALPKVIKERRELALFEIKNLGELKRGCMGIPEPESHHERVVGVGELDIVIMPGIAFDSKGGRVGYGGGYYDRLLAPRFSAPRHHAGLTGKSKGRPALVAISYAWQVLGEVPMASHDVRVHVIVTEAATIVVPSTDVSPEI